MRYCKGVNGSIIQNMCRKCTRDIVLRFTRLAKKRGKSIKNGYIVVLIKEIEGAITLKKTKGVHNVERGEILLCLGGAA